MNKEVFQKVLEVYKSKYDYINQADSHHEIYKWTAVETCIENWDVEAKDFHEMFKKAMSMSKNIIENQFVLSISGILFLCDNGKTEEVRQEFKKLLEDDNYDIKARQKRVDSFVDTINAMLDSIDSGKWKYHHSTRDALMYLAFIKPGDNYMFKATPVRKFADYSEFGGDIGSGKSFHLDEYFRLCDEVLEELKKDTELLEMLDNELECEADRSGLDPEKMKNIPGKLRISVYDIMYTANAYWFYSGFPEPVKKKKSISTRIEREKKIAARAEELNSLIEIKSAELEEIEKSIPALPEITGLEVANFKFGKGKVIGQDKHYVSVAFKDFNKEFILPDCIVKGFLSGADSETLDICKRIYDLNSEKKALSAELSRYCTELSQYE